MTSPRKTREHGTVAFPCGSGMCSPLLKSQSLPGGLGSTSPAFLWVQWTESCKPWAVCSRNQGLGWGLVAGSMCTPPCLLGPCWVLHCNMPNTLLCNLWFGVCVPHYFWKLPSFFLQVQSKCGVAVVITLCRNICISFGHGGRLGRNWHFPPTFHSDSLNITLVFASVCHTPQQNHLAVTSI